MKKLLYLPYGILLFIDWLLTLLSNLLEVVCKGIEELCLHLENFIKPNAAKSNLSTDATGTGQKT